MLVNGRSTHASKIKFSYTNSNQIQYRNALYIMKS